MPSGYHPDVVLSQSMGFVIRFSLQFASIFLCCFVIEIVAYERNTWQLLGTRVAWVWCERYVLYKLYKKITCQVGKEALVYPVNVERGNLMWVEVARKPEFSLYFYYLSLITSSKIQKNKNQYYNYNKFEKDVLSLTSPWWRVKWAATPASTTTAIAKQIDTIIRPT